MQALVHYLLNAPAVAIAGVSFFAAAIIGYLAHLKSGAGSLSLLSFVKYCFPFDAWSKASAHMDVKLYVLGRLSYRLIGWVEPLCMLIVAVAITWLLSAALPGWTAFQSTYLNTIFCALVLVIAGEFAVYWSHQLEHRIPVLWELHKVHHSATFLSPLTGARLHPLSIMFGGFIHGIGTGIPAGLFAFAFGLSVPEIILLQVSASKICKALTLEALRHSQFAISFGWFDRLLMSPHMHHVHHSALEQHWNKNFGGSLSLFDWLFGTAYRPQKDEQLVLGLGNGEERDYDDLAGVYVAPVRKAWRLAVAVPAATSAEMPRSDLPMPPAASATMPPQLTSA